jgi:hypothetical protein
MRKKEKEKKYRTKEINKERWCTNSALNKTNTWREREKRK